MESAPEFAARSRDGMQSVRGFGEGGLRFYSGRLLFPRRSLAARRVAYVSGAAGGRAGGRADSTRRAGKRGVQCRVSWNEERQIELHFPCPQALLLVYLLSHT